MSRLAAIAILLALGSGAARADNGNCQRSREYLLAGLSGDTTLPPQAYADAFKVCMAAAAMPNVRDAYILKDGAIAVVAKQDSIPATAATLSRFCDAYPHGVLRFLTRKEMLAAKSVANIVRMSASSSTPCKKIKGLA
jgi:hypothetical protein